MLTANPAGCAAAWISKKKRRRTLPEKKIGALVFLATCAENERCRMGLEDIEKEEEMLLKSVRSKVIRIPAETEFADPSAAREFYKKAIKELEKARDAQEVLSRKLRLLAGEVRKHSANVDILKKLHVG